MKRAAVAGCLWAVVLSGCDTGAGPERAAAGRTRGAADFATRPFEGVSLTELRPVAERVFRSYFRMDAASSSATEWVAFPTNIDPREPAGPNVEPTALTEDTAAEERPRETMGDVIGLAPRRYRRTAEMRLVPDQDRVVVQVRVGIQRLTTTERAAFARERGDDRPTDTAIDRLGPTSPATREEWRDYRRDRGLEQEILNAIQAGLATTQPAAE